VNGVVRTRVGYTGGDLKNPTYERMGDHTESLQIQFDPSVVSFEALLDIFWKSHNPTCRTSVQYRSAIFYHNKTQEEIAKKSKQKQENNVKTAIEAAKHWTDAEEYHQQYLAKHSW